MRSASSRLTACEEAPLVSCWDDMTIVGELTPAAGAFRRLCVDDMESAASGLSRDSPSEASTAVTRSWSPTRLPTCGSHTSLTASPRLALLWGQQSPLAHRSPRTPRCDVVGRVPSGASTICKGVSSPYAYCTIDSRAGPDRCTAANIPAQ